MDKNKDIPSVLAADDYMACLERIDMLISVHTRVAEAERRRLENIAEEFETRILSPGFLSVP